MYDYDSEGDILFFEELLSNDSPSLPENDSFHFDDPSSPRPPAKPSDDDEIKLYVHVPRLLTTQPTLCVVIDTSHWIRPFSVAQVFPYGLSWIFEASRARGFVLRSLELQSLA
ncbi:hypothetical protein Tco_0400914 [Tanacetum coccineum]